MDQIADLWQRHARVLQQVIDTCVNCDNCVEHTGVIVRVQLHEDFRFGHEANLIPRNVLSRVSG